MWPILMAGPAHEVLPPSRSPPRLAVNLPAAPGEPYARFMVHICFCPREFQPRCAKSPKQAVHRGARHRGLYGFSMGTVLHLCLHTLSLSGGSKHCIFDGCTVQSAGNILTSTVSFYMFRKGSLK